MRQVFNVSGVQNERMHELSNSDWNKSELKIKGAVREELSTISGWIDKYPKGKTLVFYCA